MVKRIVLEWIHEYFGGDPSQGTIFGDSQILAGKPLFSGVIMQSGYLSDCLSPARGRSQLDFDELVKIFGQEKKDDPGKGVFPPWLRLSLTLE